MSSTSQRSAYLKVRIVNIDHYMAEPGPMDTPLFPFGSEPQPLLKVPIVRIFGSTPAGQKVCLHIHQAFPYIYVPYPGQDTSLDTLQGYALQFGQTLNRAMALSMNKSPDDRRHNQYVAAIVPVKGIPFYGYHVGYQCYLKVYLLNPSHKTRMVELLQRGGVMSTLFQPHEAHIPFALQFLMDYNLYGMNWISLDNRSRIPIKFRSPMPEEVNGNIHFSPGSNPERKEITFTKHSVAPNSISEDYERQSHCELEVDAVCGNIINRQSINERNIHKDFEESYALSSKRERQNDSQDAKLVHSLAAIWEEESNRRASNGLSPQVPPVSQEDNRDEHEDWASEAEYKSRIHSRIEKEQSSQTDIRRLMTAVNGQEEDLRHVLTAWEAVDAISLEHDSSNIAAITPDRSLVGVANLAPGSLQARNSDAYIDEEILRTIISSEQNEVAEEDTVDAGEVYDDDMQGQEFDSLGNTGEDLEAFDDTDVIQWMALQEQGTSQRPSVEIAYEETNDDEALTAIRPRKLDFIAELSKHSQSSQSSQTMDEQGHYSTTDVMKPIHQFDGADDESDSGREAEPDDSSYQQWRRVRNRNSQSSSIKHSIDSNRTASVIPDSSLSKASEVIDGASLKRKYLPDTSDMSDRSPRQRIRRPRTAATLDIAPAPLKPSELYSPKEYIVSEQSPSDSVDDLDNQQNTQILATKIDSMTDLGDVSLRKNVTTDASQPMSILNDQYHLPESFSLSTDAFDEISMDSGLLLSFDKRDTTEEDHRPPGSHIRSANNTINEIAVETSQTSQHSRPSATATSEASEEGRPFTAKLGRMWSPKAPEEFATAFRHHPPEVTSPTESRYDTHKNESCTPAADDLNINTEQGINGSSIITSEEVTYHQQPPVLKPEQHLSIIYQEPYYSDKRDVPRRPKIYAGKEFKLKSLDPSTLEEFSINGEGIVDLNPKKILSLGGKRDRLESSTCAWTPSSIPPTCKEAAKWLEQENIRLNDEKVNTELIEEGRRESANNSAGSTSTPVKKQPAYTQIEPPTPQHRYGLKFVQTKTDAIKPIKEHLDLLSVEIHVNTRDNMLPDPLRDAIEVIYWCLQTEDENIPANGRLPGSRVGMIVCHGASVAERFCLPDIEVQYADDELQMLELFVSKVRSYDPDLLVGYELHNSSWGYIIERYINQYEINLIDELSRIKVGAVTTPRSDAWGYRKAAIFRIVGRHLLNVWRIMRSEIDLTSYRFENIVFHLLHHRIPHYSYRMLTSWYRNGGPTLKEKVCRYYLDRVQRNLELLDVSNMLSRTTESARTFGIDFYSVITRGSQFKVESMMLRIAKPENFILISPSRKQVGELSAAECLPLVMEPISRFYNSPVLVLDFQSLYPSVMIAYNYCYSTCLGKVDALKREFVQKNLDYGMDSLDLPPEILRLMEEHINVSPTGLMFVKQNIRKSLLAKMLGEILDTRVMVKRAMGECKTNKGLYRLLDARQLGLKFLANVTYGYTSATFSGRMPAVEIADSIVQTGRETLERAIKLINTTGKWGAHVVYGDTDSVFVHLPGRSRDEAFDIGNDIADTITRMNPVPVKLKFEKVYHPCVLVTKKRYVGFKYEAKDWKKPEFEAKGIETVRRDGIPATQKMMEQSLRILFRTQDMSEVKSYLQEQWIRILTGRVSEQDFILAQEVRLGEYKEGYESLGARVAMANMKLDPRAEPQYGDRIPYVIVSRGPNVKLREKPMAPLAYMSDSMLRLDAEYYITKQIIPALERIFNLCGVDIASWYKQMPRRKQALAYSFSQMEEYTNNSRTIEQYYSSRHCVVCRKVSDDEVCDACVSNAADTLFTMRMRLNDAQKRFGNILEICQSCSGVLTLPSASASNYTSLGTDTGYSDHPCDSIDCPVFFQRQKMKRDVRVLSSYEKVIDRWF